jgi:PAS domain S-box-containing protein
MILRPIFCSAIVSVALFVSLCRADNQDKAKFVVVLYPEANNGSPGSMLADSGIRTGFRNAYQGAVEIHNEFLDVSRFPVSSYQDDLAKFLGRKYAGRKIDLFIAGLSSGLDYALKYRDEIFPGAPIVFCAIDGKEIQSRQLPADVIGVPIQMDLADSLEVGLRSRPSTRRVYVVVGKSKFDQYWEGEARAAFQNFSQQVEVVYLAGLPMAQLLTQLAELPDHSLIYYLHIFEDGDGKVYAPAEALDLIARKANAPVFCHVDSYIGRGAVGGRAFSFESAGRNAGELGARLLAGEKPEAIGIQQPGENAYMFDWRQLKRWGIKESSLPAGSVVRFKVPSLWDTYKWQIGMLVSVCFLQALMITGLIVQRLQGKRAERRIQQAVDASPTGMVMIARSGEILLANAQMQALFGYRREELIGQSFELLVPARDREEHQQLRSAYFQSPQARPMGAGRELFGRRKDGSEFPIEIGLNPLRTEKGVAVLASVIDITERRAAEKELHHSHATLRELAGKLLGAEETERRRIARELHDDLGQSLALLSVELDLLQQKPPQEPARLRARVAKLSARVKQLSSSIHDLSHQLHPMKLEQLGLVAALRGLCNELSEGHGIAIDLAHDELPASIAPEVSLCLYRVGQEGLQNVIRHSQARSADVELRVSADSIRLQIQDDGIGFDDSSAIRHGGLGLASMRERVHLVNGQITFNRGSAGGTRIEVRAPLSTDGAAALELYDGVALA